MFKKNKNKTRYEHLNKIREAEINLEFQESSNKIKEIPEQLYDVYLKFEELVNGTQLYTTKLDVANCLKKYYEPHIIKAILNKDNKKINDLCLSASKLYTPQMGFIKKQINIYALSHGLNTFLTKYLTYQNKK